MKQIPPKFPSDRSNLEENIHETAGFPMGVVLLFMAFVFGAIVGAVLALRFQ